jgi:tetratricopeptide (TPR) repeat protein
MTEGRDLPAPDRAARARDLAAAGDLSGAIALLRAAPADQARAHRNMLAQLLVAADRHEEALAVRMAQAEADPGAVVHHHNVAARLGDMGRAVEAEAAVRRAFALGGDAPETWLVLARALQGQDRYDEADAALREALKRRPHYLDALVDLSQLIWMRTGDAEQGRAPLNAAIAGFPDRADLYVARARLNRFVGMPPEQIHRELTTAPVAANTALDLAAAHAALGFDPDRALIHARAAMAGAPTDAAAILQLAEIHLARHEPAAALTLLEPLLERRPLDQQALALRNTAWRLAGDPRALQPEDYAAVVAGYVIDTPPGWPTLEAWLADLAVSLRGLHGLTTHPVGQSLRHGTQTSVDLRHSDDPAIRGFFVAIDGPIRRHMALIGQGSDPLRRRNAEDYRLGGCWSVQLNPGGFHAPHFHSKGWLSSACYIALPSVVEGDGKEGWLAFGAPPFDVRTPDGVRPLSPEHHEKPAPGRLVLFPSYMWHGTVPFSGTETRLTIAFDVVPA